MTRTETFISRPGSPRELQLIDVGVRATLIECKPHLFTPDELSEQKSPNRTPSLIDLMDFLRIGQATDQEPVVTTDSAKTALAALAEKVYELKRENPQPSDRELLHDLVKNRNNRSIPPHERVEGHLMLISRLPEIEEHLRLEAFETLLREAIWFHGTPSKETRPIRERKEYGSMLDMLCEQIPALKKSERAGQWNNLFRLSTHNLGGYLLGADRIASLMASGLHIDRHEIIERDFTLLNLHFSRHNDKTRASLIKSIMYQIQNLRTTSHRFYAVTHTLERFEYLSPLVRSEALLVFANITKILPPSEMREAGELIGVHLHKTYLDTVQELNITLYGTPHAH